jgi:probable HAF family extracellular repeat protein
MVPSVRWKWFLLPILGIALLAGGLVVHVEGGKPKPPPPPPPPPPVLYGIQFWTTPEPYSAFDIYGTNNLGQVVGRSWVPGTRPDHGFLYDPWTDLDSAVDLNTLDIAGIPEGWKIRSAIGINDDGVIVGSLEKTDLTVTRMGFILDTQASPLTMEVPPNPPSSYWLCHKINNSGDVLVAYKDDATGAWGAKIYHWTTGQWGPDAGVDVVLSDYSWALSNNGQVALQVVDGTNFGLACRWTPSTGTLEPIRNGQYNAVAYGINDVGTVCGSVGAYVPAQRGKGKGASGTYPFRYATSLEVLWDGSGMSANAINSDGDLLWGQGPWTTVKYYVYQDTSQSFYDVDSLIDPNDATDAAIWCTRTGGIPAGITNRIGTTGFGQIVGMISLADGSQLGYLLTPRQP